MQAQGEAAEITAGVGHGRKQADRFSRRCTHVRCVISSPCPPLPAAYCWTNLPRRGFPRPRYELQAYLLRLWLQRRESGIFLSVLGKLSITETYPYVYISENCALSFFAPHQQPVGINIAYPNRSLPMLVHVSCRYFVAYSFDTTLGVALAIGIHMGAVRVCRRWAVASPNKPTTLWKLIADCGNYGERQ